MYKIKNNVEIEKIDNETIVVDINNGKFIKLNEMSTVLLDCITHSEIDEISLEMCKKFGFVLAKSNEIINTFIDSMMKLELIEQV